MHAYRFRMLHENQEDFLRDFDLLARQTFADFHDIIKQNVSLKGNELASFFVCDPNWRKKKEITLINMQDEEDETPAEQEERELRNYNSKKIPVVEMEKVRIKDIIDDPHQRLIFEYNFLNPVIFYIELTRILEADTKLSYPLCSKSTGDFILYTPSPLPPDEMDEEQDIAMLSEFDDILNSDEQDEDFIEPIDEVLP